MYIHFYVTWKMSPTKDRPVSGRVEAVVITRRQIDDTLEKLVGCIRQNVLVVAEVVGIQGTEEVVSGNVLHLKVTFDGEIDWLGFRGRDVDARRQELVHRT